MEFDPTLTGSAEDGLFGLPFTEEDSDLIILPVPWEATTSYGSGTSLGPQSILDASPQIDLFDLETKKVYERGIFLREIPKQIRDWNSQAKAQAQRVIELVTERSSNDQEITQAQNEVNSLSEQVLNRVYADSQSLLDQGKLVGLIGGDHSSPLGLIKALGERDTNFGILHIDAHADLRTSYQGFHQSHASIMDNVMKLDQGPQKLIQVGIRDFSEEEYEKIQSSQGRIEAYFDQRLQESLHQGRTWMELCQEVVQKLPEKVYISFDIDGLSPAFCPHTGTPVPGGLDVGQAFSLLHTLSRAGKKIIGFDLCEVAPDPKGENEWDANVGARMLYKLACLCLMTNRT